MHLQILMTDSQVENMVQVFGTFEESKRKRRSKISVLRPALLLITLRKIIPLSLSATERLNSFLDTGQILYSLEMLSFHSSIYKPRRRTLSPLVSLMPQSTQCFTLCSCWSTPSPEDYSGTCAAKTQNFIIRSTDGPRYISMEDTNPIKRQPGFRSLSTLTQKINWTIYEER